MEMEDDKSGRDLKILIVDDDQGVRDVVVRFLKTKGFKRVTSAATGKECLGIIEKEEVGLVLLDVRLPDIDGIEVLRKIKQIRNAIPVIMITGFPDEETTREAMKEGAYDYIIKPFDLFYLELILFTKIIQITFGK